MAASEKSKKAQRNLIVIVIALTAASIIYRVQNNFYDGNTSLLFVGIPALLSLVLITQWRDPKTLQGVVFRVVTLFLLLSGILFGEGLICILMAAPIFYGVAGLIVLVRKLVDKQDDSRLNSWVFIPLLLVLGQVNEIGDPPTWETTQTEVSYDHPISINDMVPAADLLSDLPLFFQTGFPVPVSYVSDGLGLGDQQTIQFESSTRGLGSLVFEVAECSDDQIVFSAIQDDTHIGRWMTWDDIRVGIVNHADGTSTVNWSSRYQCRLGPSWYFGTLEQFAVGISDEHLITAFFGESGTAE